MGIDKLDNPEKYSQMQMDIALLKQSYEKIVEPTLKDIVFKLNHLDIIHRDEYEEHKLEAERNRTQAYKDFNDYKKEVKEEFSKQSKSRFIQNTLAALFGAILAFLSQYAFKDIIVKER